MRTRGGGEGGGGGSNSLNKRIAVVTCERSLELFRAPSHREMPNLEDATLLFLFSLFNTTTSPSTQAKWAAPDRVE